MGQEAEDPPGFISPLEMGFGEGGPGWLFATIRGTTLLLHWGKHDIASTVSVHRPGTTGENAPSVLVLPAHRLRACKGSTSLHVPQLSA